MTTFIDHKTKCIIDQVNKLVPESADCEINYALKCYYLGQKFDQEELDRIVERRNKEIEELCKAMELTCYKQLEALVETKSTDNINGESENPNITN